MASKKTISMLMATIFLAMVCSTVSEDKEAPDCAQDCVPTCLKVDGSSVSSCDDVCEKFCAEQGSDIPNEGDEKQIFIGGKPKFDVDRFMQKTTEYLAILQKAREARANMKP